MMGAFDVMVKTTSLYINEINDILKTMSTGDLRKEITREYIGQYNLIKESINNILSTLRLTMTEIKTSAENVLTGAKQVSEASMDLANGSSSQASAVEELNASIELINAQIEKTTDQTKSANDLSDQSNLTAKEGNDDMSKMLQSMNDIREASAQISKIIKVVDTIAFQTNLLALNAAVEAARAGEHGKGFSVVAEEVRSLAGRTLQSAKEITEMIEDMIGKINDGTQIAELTAGSLVKIVKDTNSVSEIVNEIYKSAVEQREGIYQIKIGISQISEVVQKNSATSEESAAASEQLNGQSEVLTEMVANFKV